jgi:hypothetical protein
VNRVTVLCRIPKTGRPGNTFAIRGLVTWIAAIGSLREKDDWKRHYNYSLIGVGGRKPVRFFSNAAKWPKHDEPFFDIGFNDFKPYLKFNPWITDLFFGWRNSGSFEIKVRADLKKAKKKPPKDTPDPNPTSPAP